MYNEAVVHGECLFFSFPSFIMTFYGFTSESPMPPLASSHAGGCVFGHVRSEKVHSQFVVASFHSSLYRLQPYYPTVSANPSTVSVAVLPFMFLAKLFKAVSVDNILSQWCFCFVYF